MQDAAAHRSSRGQPTRRATARVLPGAPRAATDYFLPAPLKRLSLLGCLGWLVQLRSPTQGGATGIQRILSAVVTLSVLVLVWFVSCEAKRGEKIGFATPLYFCEAPRMVYPVLIIGAVGPCAAAAPVTLLLGNGGSRL